MKTAMQELIQEIIDSKDRGETIVNYDLFCSEFLEKEKQQIIDAYEYSYGVASFNTSTTPEQYYTGIFKTN